jgi:hypothetical protein
MKYWSGAVNRYDIQQMNLYGDTMKSITTVYLHLQEEQVCLSKLDKKAVEHS